MDGKDSVEMFQKRIGLRWFLFPLQRPLLRYDVKKLWIDGWMEKVDGCEREICIGILDSS